MNLAAAVAIAAAAVAIYAGTVARRFALAPGWGDQHWFSLVAYGAAAYALGNVATTLAWPDAMVIAASHLQLAACFLQLWGWYGYADAFVGRRPGPLERYAVSGALVLMVASLIPHVGYTHAVVSHAFGGVTYRDAVPTPAGEALFLLGLVGALPILWRLVVAWRQGRRHAGLHALAFGMIFVFGVNDALAASGLARLPYLLDVGFVLPVGAVAWSITHRFVDDARALHGLRGRLETLVEERTHALAQAQAALLQAEKLAALGQFAAGVAHEVNNPASVVSANLRFLATTAAAEGAPAESQESIAEALQAMQRINALVRRLVDAGRLAAAPPTTTSTALATVARQVVDEAAARAGGAVRFEVDGLEGIHVSARAEVLHQILGALLQNAADAIPEGRGGLVRVSAARTADGHLRIAVADDGVGMSAEVLRRAYDPFFTTKPEGRGSGLGLPVARALVESHGGELTLESQVGRGTVASVELPEAAPAA